MYKIKYHCNPLDPNSTLNMDRGGIKSSRAKWTTAKVLPLKKIIKKILGI